MNGVTTDNFAPVMKERYSNPIVSRMLTKLRRNNRPKKHSVRTHTKIRERRRLPIVSTVPNA